MVSRFTKFAPRNYSISVPDLRAQFIPNFAAWDGLLAQQQKTYDDTLQVAETVPDHLSQDADYVNQYMTGLQSKIDGLTKTYTSKGVSEGNRERAQLMRQMRRDYQPGGAADIVAKRKQQYNATSEQLDKIYKDHPKEAQFLKSQIQVNPIDQSTGLNNLGITAPNTPTLFTLPEESKYFNDILDNISADTVVGGTHMSKVKGMSFKSLLEEGSTKYIDWNKAAMAVYGSLTPELKASFDLKDAANGITPQDPLLKNEDGSLNLGYDPSELNQDGTPKENAQGKIQFNVNSTLGNRLNSLVTGKIFTENKVDRQVITDNFGSDIALARFKKDLEDKAKPLPPPETLGPVAKAATSGKNVTLGSKNITITDDNKILLNGSASNLGAKKREEAVALANRGYIMGAVTHYLSGIGTSVFGSDKELTIDSKELKPVVTNLRNAGHLDDIDSKLRSGEITPKEAERTIASRVVAKMKNNSDRNNTEVAFTPYNLEDRAERAKLLMTTPTDETQGLLQTRPLYNALTGDLVKPSTLKESETKTTTTVPLGKITEVGSTAPYGSEILQQGNDVYILGPSVVDRQKPEYLQNRMWSVMNGGGENDQIQFDLPEGNAYGLPEGMYEATYIVGKGNTPGAVTIYPSGGDSEKPIATYHQSTNKLLKNN